MRLLRTFASQRSSPPDAPAALTASCAASDAALRMSGRGSGNSPADAHSANNLAQVSATAPSSLSVSPASKSVTARAWRPPGGRIDSACATAAENSSPAASPARAS